MSTNKCRTKKRRLENVINEKNKTSIMATSQKWPKIKK